ncbi:MAG TPA: hypothetical protein VEH01_01085 [Nitrososphaerales archaeon]|nr:hypothetical protein [Nitrososphaerales archaeon]
MSRICVATSKARAYYALVSRLKRAGLPFSSALPGSDFRDWDLVLTTAEEAGRLGEKALALEELDENPGIFRGQVISRLSGESEVILVGVDPGKRTGMAVFYGQTKLASSTFDSVGTICSRIGAFARGIPSSRVLIRVGNGNGPMVSKLVDGLRREVPDATIEVVDESGTSTRSPKMRGVQRDQVAAARIAFRKGDVVSRGTTRTRD